MEPGVPNLDAMPASELWALWNEWNVGKRPLRVAQALFPGRRAGIIKATVALRCYAANKATAMQCRSIGAIVTAQAYEAICDGIYARLPGWARW